MSDILDIADEFRRAILRRERKSAARLVAAYDRAWLRIKKQLDALTADIAEARAKGEIVNQFWLARQVRYFELLRQVTEELRKFEDVAESTIKRQQLAAVKAGLANSTTLMQTAASEAGISATFNRLPVAAVENMVGTLSNGSPLRTLLDQLPRAGRKIVEDGLIQGVALGWNPAKTARAIREGLDGNRTRALTIARTETLRVFRNASLQNYRANPETVRGWVWRSSRSRRCCGACIALDGKFFPLTQPTRNHVRCRCTLLPSTRTLNVDSGVDWFEKQPAEVQRAILGTDKGYELYRRGELKLEDFVGLKRDPRWGETYHQLSVKRAVNGEGQFPK